jgi:hypothetical protein
VRGLPRQHPVNPDQVYNHDPLASPITFTGDAIISSQPLGVTGSGDLCVGMLSDPGMLAVSSFKVQHVWRGGITGQHTWCNAGAALSFNRMARRQVICQVQVSHKPRASHPCVVGYQLLYISVPLLQLQQAHSCVQST